MPYKKGQAGKSTFEMADNRYKTLIKIGVGGIVIFVIILFIFNHATALGIGGGGFLILLFLILGFRNIFEGVLDKKGKEVKRARRGAKAEVKVDSLLDELSEDYCVLNDVESGYGNIDHIVISKYGGIFLIETKSHGGRVTVENGELLLNGYPPEKNFITQTLNNAYWLRDRVAELTGIKSWITPLIVFTNAFVPFNPPLRGIKILNKKFLVSTIEKSNTGNASNLKVWEAREIIEEGLLGETQIPF